VWGVRSHFGLFDYDDPSGKTLLGERFFLGALDMRAWGQRRVLAPSYAGDRFDLRPGGDLLTYVNTDVAWHLHRDLALVAFVDVGRVWEDTDEIAIDQLLTDVGVSVAANLIGSSLRLDLAYRPTLQASDNSSHGGVQLWLDLPW
jgi:hypothetical protein